MRRLAAIVVLAGLAFAAPALAEWSVGNLDCCSLPTGLGRLRDARIFDLPSGDLGVLAVSWTGMSNAYNLQRVTRDGAIASGWPADGVNLNTLISGHTLRVQSVVSDGDGYVWRTFHVTVSNSTSAAAQYVTPGGVLTPTTYPNYYVAGTTGYWTVHAAPLPNGDMYVTRDASRINRIQRNGNPGFGWTSTGLALPGYSYDDNAILPDGSGGAIVFMRNAGAVLATRIDSNKVVHAGWPSGGLALSTLPGAPDLAEDSFLIPSGTDHFLAAWSYPDPSGSRRMLMQRFGLDATVDPAWPATGLEVVASDTLESLTIIGDGQGGAYVLRHNDRAPVASHVSSAGAFVGGRDVSILGPGAKYVPTSAYYYSEYDYSIGSLDPPDELIADHTPGGGLVVGYGDARLAAPSFRVRWLLPDLTADPQKSDGTPGTDSFSMLAIRADGSRSAFVAWGGISYDGDLWMTRVTAPDSPLTRRLKAPPNPFERPVHPGAGPPKD